MDRSHYLHVHLPGRGRVTLSLPSGVERAIISGKLTADAQVWYEQINLWISISRHPGVAALLSRVQLPSPPEPPRAKSPPVIDLERPPIVYPEPATESRDPAQLALIPLEQLDVDQEFTEFLKRSWEAEERRKTARSSAPTRPSSPARLLVAGAMEPERRPRFPPGRWFPRDLVPGWAAAAALALLGSLAVGLFLARSGGEGPVAPVMVTNALSANGRGVDSTPGRAALAGPNPLAGEERELETNLRIAEAVVWQPAIDFSPELIKRSARKVGAVRNSISLYRIGAWRHMDSVGRDNDPRLEPYEEAVRIDEVLNLVQSAVTVLDSLIGAFRVHGELLVFSDSAQAARYSWLWQRANSLIHIPVVVDSAPFLRAPRRIVTRLLETLPAAVVRTP
jgi:hypothetical protein